MKQEMIQKSKTEEENRKALIDKFQGSLDEITKSLGKTPPSSPPTQYSKYISEKNSEFNSTLKQDNDRLRNSLTAV